MAFFGKTLVLKECSAGAHQWRGVIEEYRDPSSKC